MKTLEFIVTIKIRGIQVGNTPIYKTLCDCGDCVKEFFVENDQAVAWTTETGEKFYLAEYFKDNGSLVLIKYQGQRRFFNKETRQAVVWVSEIGEEFCLVGYSRDRGSLILIEYQGQQRLFDKKTYREVKK